MVTQKLRHILKITPQKEMEGDVHSEDTVLEIAHRVTKLEEGQRHE